jgi:hypothetical protein
VCAGGALALALFGIRRLVVVSRRLLDASDVVGKLHVSIPISERPQLTAAALCGACRDQRRC